MEPHEHVCRICGERMGEMQPVATIAERSERSERSESSEKSEKSEGSRRLSSSLPGRIGTSAIGDNRRIVYEPPEAPAETISLSEKRIRSRTRRRVWGIVVVAGACLAGALVYIAVAHQAQNPRQTFVRATYEHLLAREPNSNQTASWTNKMAQGTSRLQVATDIVNSREYRNDVVSSYYKAYLGHPANSAAFAFWGRQLSAGGSDQNVEEGILGSAEFYSDSGGTAGRFVAAVYEKLLGRAPTTADVASAEAQLSRGASHTTIATEVIDSEEYRSDFVDSYYQYLIGHRPDKADFDHWLFLLSGGAPDQAVVAGIVGSSEFNTLKT
ncbi:MAG: DUF4214 domain-containing protein [Nitrososphaerales archaeon]